MTQDSESVVPGQRWQHVNRGTSYEVIGIAELQAGQPQFEHAELVIYRGDDGELWARNSAEFADGRFTLAAAPSTSVREEGDVEDAVLAGRAVLAGEGDGTYDEACNAIRQLLAALVPSADEGKRP